MLGVRDSVSGRRVLTAEERADVRARIAQRLGQSPSLLVLDNCEHLIEGVAELVAFLVSTTAELRVLTTSRAPLAIAAERVYLLGQLEVSDAAQLFCERALAARPTARLSEDVVASIVGRLDGLPLAIELAAAKVRAMSVEEIDERLENRFALLRGGDRSAPDRHQTLLAVIDWSWNLLDDGGRRALRRLALFHDGLSLEAAREVLGDDAVDAVQGLVDQSLLSVRETPTGLRYRMLETVREFGRMQLVDAGEDAEARDALRRWATAYARLYGARLPSSEQLAAIDALSAEEVNLADELRGAITGRDVASLVQLLAALGIFWAIRGEHARAHRPRRGRGRRGARLAAAARPGGRDPRGDDDPDEQLDDRGRGADRPDPSHAAAAGPRVRRRSSPRRVDQGDDGLRPGRPRQLPTPDRGARRRPRPGYGAARVPWLSHARENVGDLAGAVEAASRALALATDDDGPWQSAILRPSSRSSRCTLV